MGSGEREEMRRTQTLLSCGMTVADIETISHKRVRTWDVPDTRATHSISSEGDFATVWLVIKDGRLMSSELIFVEGLTGTRTESRKDHCA
jgi:hypothetical protein